MEMTAIDPRIELLRPFCAPAPTRYDLTEPFTEGDWTYATDGKVAVRVPAFDVPAREGRKPIMNEMPWWKTSFDFEGNPIPPLPQLQWEPCGECKGEGVIREAECSECGGDGEVEWHSGRHYYSDECQECYGEGVIKGKGEPVPCEECGGTPAMRYPEITPFEMPNTDYTFDAHILAKIAVLPGVAYQILDRGVLQFRFDGGGQGLTLGLRK